IHGRAAASDPTPRCGPNGLCLLSGMAFDRSGKSPLGNVFVSRFRDNNNTESGDPFQYIDTIVTDSGTAGFFLDKPWIAWDEPRSGSTFTCSGLQGNYGSAFQAFSVFTGTDPNGNNPKSKITFGKSNNCGVTWVQQKLSETFNLNQGTVIAVDP